jgi:hypothetical protein
MLIAGTFREYPFSLLLEIFLRRKETGLLEISSTEESGYFYIKNGKVKDGQIGKNKGIAALRAAGEFNDGSFKFKPLEPADYARIAWQRSFGPIGYAISPPATNGAGIANRLGQLRFDPEATRRVLNDLGSSAHQVLRQFLLYASIAYYRFQRIRSYLQRRTVACTAAGFDFWRRARVGKNLQQILLKALTALLEDKRRREKQLKYTYPHKVSLQQEAILSGTTVGSVRQHELEHNVIFVLTVTLLLALSGLLLHQLLFENQDSMDTGVAVDENTQIPANTTHTTTKPKRAHRKRPSVNKPVVTTTDAPY